MGQLIEFATTRIGEVAVFDLDRSLTGQEGEAFTHSPEGNTPTSTLARRLWQRLPEIDTIHVLSNTVTIRSGRAWTEEDLEVAGETIARLFVYYEVPLPGEHEEALRLANYNATITSMREANTDLRIIRVTPDEPVPSFEAGQYTHLGLGYWEPRADEATEDFDPGSRRWDRMARRAYSVSSSIVDDHGDLVAPHPEAVEFYIVKVPPHLEEIPALTPRLFRKGVGDRLYMSHKFTGHYTLEGVGPDDTVLFLGTGTGEAPHNKMTAELLRSGHKGQILSVSCVRYRADLGYLEQHERAESRFPNYRFVPLTTREPENEGNKVYVQDYLRSGRAEKDLGVPLNPTKTHVFLCGNPLMIGLPTWQDETPTFPAPTGVCEILHERGFTIDRAGHRGNVHYEEYWKER